MSASHVVSAADFERIAAEDDYRRAHARERDFAASVLTAVSMLLTLLMLVIGPLWLTIDLFADGAYSSSFEQLWVVPVALTLIALVPLALSFRRERTPGQQALALLLVGTLVLLLVRCPFF